MKNLRRAYKKARRGKRAKWYVREFENELDKNLLRLQKELHSQTYQPLPMDTFVIRDPKTRVISASVFRDRIVHHVICNVVEPIFEKTFIFDSYANRKGKGTLAAIKRFEYFARKVSGNGKLLSESRDNNQVYGYVLKADIRHYFDSVNHGMMMRIIGRKIKDKKVLWMINKILHNHNYKTPFKGMSIGNLTSQFFANVYLNELDYFVKHRLKAKYYIRYVDDFVLLDASKEKLEEYKTLINEFLKTIKLELHPQKSRLIPLKDGVKLLGFRIFFKHKLPDRRNVRKIRQRIVYLADLYKDSIIGKTAVLESLKGWNAYAMHANTFKLRNQIMDKLQKSLGTGTE